MLLADLRGKRQPDRLQRRAAVLRRQRRQLADRPEPARRGDRGAQARRRPRPRGDRRRPLRQVLRLRRDRRRLRAARRHPHPGRRRVARRHLPRRAPSGSQAPLAALSFNGNKIITTSGGGALAGSDDELVAHARKLSTQAREPVPHYEHTEIGFNYRLSNLLAAVGRAQLAVLPERVAARQRINARYRELLGDAPGIDFMPASTDGTSNCWLTCITVDPGSFGADREQIRLALEAEDIESRPVWKPMHLQPVFADSPIYGGDVSARLFERGLCLPSGSAMTDDDQDRVVRTLLATRSRTVAPTASRRPRPRRSCRRRRASATSGRCGRSPCRGSSSGSRA